MDFLTGFKNFKLGRLALALILALFVWGYVSLTVYPEQTNTYDGIPVEVRNPSATNLIVRNTNIKESVTVTVSGPRDKLTSITSSSLKPFVDLTKLTKPTTDQFKMELRVPDGVRYSIKPEKIEIQVEEIKISNLKAEVQPVGEVSPDYTLSDIKITPAMIEISGPDSQVAQVKRAVARVDVSNRNLSLVARTTGIVLLGANDIELKLDQVRVNPDTATVDIRVNPNFQNRDVPIRVTTVGQPALGYVVGSASRDPQFVTIFGEPNIISQINYIETEPVDVNGANSDIVLDVALVQPKNVLVSADNKRAKVRIAILPLDFSTSLEYQVQQINIGPGLRYDITPSLVTITLSGPYKVFQDLQQKQFKLEEVKVEVNLEGKGVGVYSDMPVKITAPDGLKVINSPTVTVRIVPQPTATPIPTLPPFTPTPSVSPTTEPSKTTVIASSTIGTTAAPSPTTPPVTHSPTTRT
ncbi:CdaR family protein [Candidatus Chlorohelix sp.]|uniref:CdaR family protein n=1 Tax=Candidatus Chlorohelix sp. TaxID=3139201 RepID=UPI003067D15A